MKNILDDEWIQNFEAQDLLYKDFYKENVNYINIRFLYVNNEKSMITHLNNETFFLKRPNIITKEEIFQLIKLNVTTVNNKKYKLSEILKYNFALDVEDVKNYLQDITRANYISKVNYIDDVIFEKTISMFQDLNEIIFIFTETSINNLKTKKNRRNVKIKTHKKPFKG